MLQNRFFLKYKTTIRIAFVVFQIIFIALAYLAKDNIILETSWPKKYSTDYLHWWFNMYEIQRWHWSIDFFVIASNLVLAITIGVFSEYAYEQKVLSVKQIGFCFFIPGLLRIVTHYMLCTMFEHYYQYFRLLDTEFLCIVLLLLSEFCNKPKKKLKG